jgi:tetratricopeptide (TPR) repeat protein
VQTNNSSRVTARALSLAAVAACCGAMLTGMLVPVHCQEPAPPTRVLLAVQPYLDLLDRYRRNPTDGVREMLTWSRDRVSRGVAAFTALRTPVGQVTDAPGAFAAVMLHTDAALTAATRDRGPVASLHLLNAALLMEYATNLVPNKTRHPFSRGTWYLTVTRVLNGLQGWDVEESLFKELGRRMHAGSVTAAVERMVAEQDREAPGVGAQLLLALGSLEDGSAQMDRRERGFEPSPKRVDDSLIRDRLRQAEHFYRRALELDPALLEARLRLGALLVDTESTAAQIELRQVLAQAREPRQRYLAFLFLGQIEEKAGRHDRAIGLYARALAAWPRSQVARIALGNAQDESGDVAPAQALIVAFFGHATSEREQDPWSGYFNGQKDEGLRMLDDMRGRVVSSR